MFSNLLHSLFVLSSKKAEQNESSSLQFVPQAVPDEVWENFFFFFAQRHHFFQCVMDKIDVESCCVLTVLRTTEITQK